MTIKRSAIETYDSFLADYHQLDLAGQNFCNKVDSYLDQGYILKTMQFDAIDKTPFAWLKHPDGREVDLCIMNNTNHVLCDEARGDQ